LSATITGFWQPCQLCGLGGCFGACDETAKELGIVIEYQVVTPSGQIYEPILFEPESDDTG